MAPLAATNQLAATEMSDVVVIGAGLAGLTAARDLHLAGHTVRVIEAADRIGGKIWSSPVGERDAVDLAADNFLARVPEATTLVRELGLGDDLVSPASTVPAYIGRDGALFPLPAGLAFGVPTDLDALAASGVVSADAVDRARRDADATDDPAGLGEADVSVGSVTRARLGDEITDWLIDPLTAGINAGDVDQLSLGAGAPILDRAARADVSLIRGIRSLRPATGPTLGSAQEQPVFHGVRGGTARILVALADSMPTGTITTGVAATRVTGTGVHLADGSALTCDRVVLAVEARHAARLLEGSSPDTAEALATIPTASVAQVTFEFDEAQLGRTLDASGALFPVAGDGLMTGSTWLSTKWVHHRRPGRVLVRATSGRHHDTRARDLPDDELVRTLLDETRAVIRTESEPTAVRLQRWNDALPQYTVGHRARVDMAIATLADRLPSVRLTGASYRGIGIPAVIGEARSVAASIDDPAGAPR